MCSLAKMRTLVFLLAVLNAACAEDRDPTLFQNVTRESHPELFSSMEDIADLLGMKLPESEADWSSFFSTHGLTIPPGFGEPTAPVNPRLIGLTTSFNPGSSAPTKTFSTRHSGSTTAIHPRSPFNSTNFNESGELPSDANTVTEGISLQEVYNLLKLTGQLSGPFPGAGNNSDLIPAMLLAQMARTCTPNPQASSASMLQSIVDRLDAFEDRQKKLEETVSNFQSKVEGSVQVVAIQQTVLQSTLARLAAQKVSPQHSSEDVPAPGNNHTRRCNFNATRSARTDDVNLEQVTDLQEAVADLEASQTDVDGSIRELKHSQRAQDLNLTMLAGWTFSLEGTISTLSSNQSGLRNSMQYLLRDQAKLKDEIVNQVMQEVNASITQLRVQVAMQLLEDRPTASGSPPPIAEYQPKYLGYPCQNDTDCIRSVPNSTCSEGKFCTCSDGYRQNTIRQCDMIRLGDACMGSSRCHTYTEGAACRNGVCSCGEEQWNRNNLECRTLRDAGQSCELDRDCSADNSSCVDGKCGCVVGKHGDYEYTLAGGPNCMEGRVQLRREGGQWGHVCDDKWTSNDAKVLCRSLGFRGENPHCCSKFGRSGKYYMDEVRCNGNEKHLLECSYAGWGREDCGDGETAGVTCKV